LYRAGIISKEEARLHPMNNILNAALGFRSEIPIHLHALQHEPGAMYMLCTDGLSDMLPEPLMERILGDCTGTGDCCDALVAQALDRGGNDNITVVLIRP